VPRWARPGRPGPGPRPPAPPRSIRSPQFGRQLVLDFLRLAAPSLPGLRFCASPGEAPGPLASLSEIRAPTHSPFDPVFVGVCGLVPSSDRSSLLGGRVRSVSWCVSVFVARVRGRESACSGSFSREKCLACVHPPRTPGRSGATCTVRTRGTGGPPPTGLARI
jgi:hypothetical protein